MDYLYSNEKIQSIKLINLKLFKNFEFIAKDTEALFKFNKSEVELLLCVALDNILTFEGELNHLDHVMNESL